MLRDEILKKQAARRKECGDEEGCSVDGKVVLVRKDGSRRVVTVNRSPSKTDPSMQDECNVNLIMDRFHRTGQISHLANAQGIFADVSNVVDLLGSMQRIESAKAGFAALSPQLRSFFKNKMENMVAFLADSQNDELAIEMGLKVAPKVPDKFVKSKPEAIEATVKVPIKKDVKDGGSNP